MKVHVKVLLALVMGINLMASDINDGDIALKNQDPAKAMQLYQRACDAGNKTGCDKLEAAKVELNKMLTEYAEKLVNYYKTINDFKTKCSDGDIDSCYTTGVFYDSSPYKKIHGYENADIDALKYFKKACNNNHPKACLTVGEYNYFGTKNISINKNIAIQYYKKACDLGNKIGCDNLKIIISKEKNL